MEGARRPLVAYFCMEYGLHEELHTYAGGLGVLAGDHLKAAREIGLPLVGVGLLWRQGYTTQLIGEGGRPYDTYPDFRYDFLEDTGVRLCLRIRDRQVAVKVWLVDRYGNAPLYLLDTDLPENPFPDRAITAQLYGGSAEDRVAQEMVLGIGGVRALRRLGLNPTVYHFNEGHAVFAGIELIREQMERGLSFEDAREAVREQIVFTTHTPVSAGNEVHDHGLLRYMEAYHGLSYEQMRRIGGDPFGMTVAGLRLARLANGVSALHGRVARAMWSDVDQAAPIVHITNGVHPGTWQDPRIRAARGQAGDLWEAHLECKRELLQEVEARTGLWLDPAVLTIGFARRAAPYKRPDLIFRDPGRIVRLLESGRLQLLFSGKAHPRDEAAKEIVARLVDWARRFPGRVVFLQNYDMRLARVLTRGCDVWLNNPQRPLEASGTSGMKAAMNGVLNLSVLDGWWAEACEHGVNGWQFGGGYVGEGQADHDARALYDVLEREVIPTFYGDRDRWVRMMGASIDMSARFTAHRMVEQYRQLMYGL
ncbi:alpha-glucan family phosphorylase [Caldinitratiruptor microaerophilus]|uniref:glycogen phosphorylase n=1 Tax=Caldinitratiruptor microaerophilus TaxID=671077 RepID=A0AA35CM51_9FIRM|nr:alpha-glucan family phosphorylase [Caldinitratiruptor microaerophilus]BDG60913.1 alpha-1,4 glucan phosphorylase [Caldinitratiruptor microaerophilus]